MELHRRRTPLITGTFFILAGLVILFCVPVDSALHLVIALVVSFLAVTLGVWRIYGVMQPFRFHIGPDGLTLRVKKINRLVAWPEIHAVVLAGDIPVPLKRPNTSTRLLLVPASASFEARLDQTSPVDGRPCVQILSFGDVKEDSVQVAEALAGVAGERFVDTRETAAQAVIPEFMMVLRGYDPATVDALIARAQAAIRDDNAVTRMGAKAQFDADVAKDLPIALRGYDRAQVAEVLSRLSDQIARWEEPRPSD